MSMLTGPPAQIHFTYLRVSASASRASLSALFIPQMVAWTRPAIRRFRSSSTTWARQCLLDTKAPRAWLWMKAMAGFSLGRAIHYSDILGASIVCIRRLVCSLTADKPPRDRSSELRGTGFPTRRVDSASQKSSWMTKGAFLLLLVSPLPFHRNGLRCTHASTVVIYVLTWIRLANDRVQPQELRVQ
ncbi:hypothetical protein GGX14DRAFT_571742 [Mycena pura]|uniref:Uncharacterized protein n=1 Tax=Mycena pura TaxID=153505 RepID=A0AAD6V3A3_9AGAR|nr:hypothetical protein GGX14DRAFT_571742 [Mycena pura]